MNFEELRYTVHQYPAKRSILYRDYHRRDNTDIAREKGGTR